MADGSDGGRFLSYLSATRLHDVAIPVTREFLDADPGPFQKGRGGAEVPLRRCPPTSAEASWDDGGRLVTRCRSGPSAASVWHSADEPDAS